MATRARLDSLEIRNYLGAGDEPVTLEFNGEHAVLCGPNGSGKTTVLSALDRVRRINWVSVLMSYSVGHVPSEVSVWEWVDGRPHVTAQLFHSGSQTFCVRAGFILPTGLEERRRIQSLLDPIKELADETVEATVPSQDSLHMSFTMVARADQKVQLESITIEEQELFRIARETSVFSFLPSQPGAGVPGVHRYKLSHEDPRTVFEPLDCLLGRAVYFPSHRQARLGPDTNVSGLAGGEGLVNWIEAATRPNPKDAESAQRHHVLQEFQQEFAEFIGAKSVALYVQGYALPLPDNEQPEIAVTIDGRVRLLSQLGAGIGEALIVLFVSKLSQKWRHPPVDILLLEEPELHLHPTLQRKLLEQLARYGVQLIAATHSPAVINWFARSGGRVFRTEFQNSEKRTTARQISGLTELRSLIESIGASPADVVLADKALLVEGNNDVPVFKAWLGKAPSYAGQSIAVLALGGSDAASGNFDPAQWRSLHPKIRAILDSERNSADQDAHKERQEIKAKLEGMGIGCHLTERRSTESYFTPSAVKVVYGDCPSSLDPFGDSNLAKQGVKQFKKSRNGEVAQAMEWRDIETTDIGKQIEDFLRS